MNDNLPTPTFALDLSGQKAGPLVAQAELQVTGRPQVVQDPLLGQIVQLGAQDSIAIAAPEPGKPFSIALWVKPDQTLDNSWAPLLSMGEDSGPHWAFGVGGGKDGLIWSYGQQPQRSLDLDKPIDRGVWSHVALSYDGTLLSLYVNGKLGSSTTLPDGLPWPEGAALYLGTHLQSTRLQKTMPFTSVNNFFNVGFNSDSSRIVIPTSESIKIFDSVNGDLISEISASGLGYSTIAIDAAVFSQDDTRLLTLTRSYASVWDNVNRKRLIDIPIDSNDAISGALNHNGTRIVIASNRSTKIYNAEGQFLHNLEVRDHCYSTSVMFNNDGTRLVTSCGDSIARLYDGEGQWLCNLNADNSISSAAFNRDGTRIVTIGFDVKIWDSKGQLLHKFGFSGKTLSVTTFNHNSTYIVAVVGDTHAGDTAKVWDITNEQCLYSIPVDDVYKSVAFSPNNTQLITQADGPILSYWLLPTPFAGSIAHACIYSQAIPDSSLRNVILEHIPGPLLDMKLDRVIGAEGQPKKTLNREADSLSFKLLPNGGAVAGQASTAIDDVFGRALLFHGGDDGVSIPDLAPLMATEGVLRPFSLELWVKPDMALSNSWTPALSVGEATGPFWALIVGGAKSGLLWSNDGQNQQSLDLDQPIAPGQWSNLTLTYDGSTLSLYVNGKLGKSVTLLGGLPWPAQEPLRLGCNQSLGQQLYSKALILKGDDDAVCTATFSPSGVRIVTITQQGTATLWDAKDGKVIKTLGDSATATSSGTVFTAAFSPDGTCIVTGGNNTAIWDAKDGQLIRPLGGSGTAAFSPDGTCIVTAGDIATIWDAKDGKRIKTLDSGKVITAAFSPNGTRIITTNIDGILNLWDAKSKAIIATIEHVTNQDNSMAFNSDGTRIVVIRDKVADLWDTTKKQIIANLPHTELVVAVTFSPDDTRILTASYDHTAQVWDASTGKHLKTLDTRDIEATGGNGVELVSAAFSPDGILIAAGSIYGEVVIWSDSDGRLRKTMSDSTINSVAFSPDVTRIIAASSDSAAYLWWLPSSFAGLMANLKLTLGAPPAPEQVKQQVERAILKAASGTVFPLEFSLENDQKQAVIYLGNVPKSVHFLVKNTGRRAIYFDHGGQAASHFELRFRPGTLADPQNIAIAPDPKWPGWSLAYHREPDGTDVLGFSHTPGANTADSALMPGEALPLTLTNVRADERGGSRSTRVQLRYSLQYDNFSPVEGSRLHYLAILQMPESEIQNNLNALINEKLPDLSVKQDASSEWLRRLDARVTSLAQVESKLLQLTAVPLAAWVEGSPFIINNGKTKNNLCLQIGHIGGQQDGLKLHNKDGVRTSFRFEFYQDKDWGLFGKLDHTAGDSLDKMLQAKLCPDKGGWSESDWEIVGTASELALLYKGAEPADFSAGMFICLQISFTCSLAPGQAYVVINYENIGEEEVDNGKKSYPHGHLSLNLIRSPFAPERSKDGTTKTVVSGKLDLVQTAESLPTIELYRGGWQVSKENAPDATLGLTDDSKPEISAPDATLGLTDDGKLEISSQHGISLKGGVVAENLTINGEFHADGHTISAKEVNAVGVTADAYKLTGYEPHLHDYGYIVPKGGIIMWSGRPEDIPQGWVLCDGRQVTAQGKFVTTPDLTDKFIRGAGRTYNPGTSGGQALVTLTEREMPQHAHSITDPKHKHTLPNTQIGRRVEFAGWNGHNEVYFQVPMDMNKEVDAQGTGISINPSGDGQPFPIIPPFYALCFIMKL